MCEYHVFKDYLTLFFRFSTYKHSVAAHSFHANISIGSANTSKYPDKIDFGQSCKIV